MAKSRRSRGSRGVAQARNSAARRLPCAEELVELLDLSNNNSTGHDFHVAYHQGGQRRVYLKRCQGIDFIDKTYPGLRERALAAGLEVGAYDFLEPLKATPTEAAEFLLKLTPAKLVHGRDLRDALDCEYGSPSRRVGIWIMQVANQVADHIGARPLIYGSPSFLEACQFPHAPGPLWLASYGRNDGKKYPPGPAPHPWQELTAYQWTEKAHVPGIHGPCDRSDVYLAANLEIPLPRPEHKPTHKPTLSPHHLTHPHGFKGAEPEHGL